MRLFFPGATYQVGNETKTLRVYFGWRTITDALDQFQEWTDEGFRLSATWLRIVEDGKEVAKYPVKRTKIGKNKYRWYV